MTGIEKRRHPRFLHRAKIRVIVPSLAREFLVEMRDFSESGIFLLWPDPPELEIGTTFELQTTEFENAPIQTAQIVRIKPGEGIAAQFV